MQILRWLFKNANDTNSSKKEVVTEEEVKSQDIVLLDISRKKGNQAGKSGKSRCKILNLFKTLRRKDMAADYFYSTIRVKRMGSWHCMKMKKQRLTSGLSFRRKADSATAKVLPVSDAVRTAASKNGHKEQNLSADQKEKADGDKIETVSKMKELIKWAAAAKSQKGGKYFGRKTVPDDDELSYGSPKISFRWDVDQSSSANMVYKDQCPTPTTKGNWVTTDSECKFPLSFFFNIHSDFTNGI